MTGLVFALWAMAAAAMVIGDIYLHGRNQPWSRTPDGSTNAGPAHPQERPAGVETQARTSPPTPVGTVSTLPPVDCAHRASAPADAGDPRTSPRLPAPTLAGVGGFHAPAAPAPARPRVYGWP